MRFEEGLKKTAFFIRDNISRDRGIFLDKNPSRNKNAWSQDGWYAYANRTPGADVSCSARDHYWTGDVFNKQCLTHCIVYKKSRILVLFKDGLVNNFLNNHKGYLASIGFYKKKLFEYKGYSVVEIVRARGNASG